MRPNPGDVIGGKYRIVRLIGDGGMGAVYEARHEVLGSPVALKFLHAELSKRPGLASRFLQEARVSASIQSPHVTRVTDVDQTPDGAPYLVMELLTGESLQQILDRTPKLKRDQAVDYALQILAGLEAAHALGVVHRDLKPDNVFVTPSGGGPVLKLLDFGIAKLRESKEYQRGLTRPGAVMGTPEYMAPEQLYAADRVDHRADLYSLGAILYEMLAGERPAYGDDAGQIVAQVVQGRVRPLLEHDASLPAGLAEVVHRAIDPDKNRRFASAMEMRTALAPYTGELSHAGRLAATPAPASVIPAMESMVPKPPQSAGVAPTLPPEEEPGVSVPAVPPLPKGATQEASAEVMQRITTALHAAAPGTAPPPSSLPLPPGVGYPPTYGSHVGAPPPRRSGNRTLGALFALLLGLSLTAALIGLVVLLGRGHDDDEDKLPLDSTPPPTTIEAQADEVSDASAPPAPPPATAPETPAPPPKAGGRRDGGTDAGDAESPTVPFPFPLPSALPPLPSGFPPLPTGFPPIFPPTNVAPGPDSG